MRGGILLLSCALALAMFSGVEAQEKTIVIWHSIGSNELIPFRNLIEEFMIDHPGINVVLEQRADMENVLQVAISSNTGPDLFFWAHDWVGKMAEGGLLEPIDEYISEDFLSNFSEVARDAMEYDGHYYGVPYAAESVALIYNKGLVKNAPESFEDVERIMKEQQNRGLYGMTTNPIEPYYLAPWVHTFGGYLFADDSKKAGLDLPETIKGVNFFFDRIYPFMPQSDDYNVQISVFRDGKSPFLIDGPWAIPDTKNQGIDVGIIPLPPVKEGGKEYYPEPYSGVKGIYVTKNVKDRDTVWEFLRWFSTSDEVAKTLALRNGYIPVLPRVLEDPQIKNDPVIYGFAKQIEHATLMPKSPEMGGVWDPARSAALSIMSGKLSVEEALKRGQSSIQRS